MNYYKQYSFDNDVYFDDLIEILLETNDFRALQLVVLANNIGMPTRKPIHLFYDVVSVEYADNLDVVVLFFVTDEVQETVCMGIFAA